MIAPRKMTLQLTPLLDLLLIVIFAQYLEVQESQDTIQSNAVAAEEARDAALNSLAQREEQLLQVQAQMAEVKEREKVIAEIVSEILDLSEATVQNVLNQKLGSGSRTAAEVERLKERFRQTASKRSGRVIEHLLTYEEIRKRCDVWDIHVTPENFLVLTSGEKTLQLQIPLDIDEDFVQQDFIDKFIEMAHTLPEPKSLVLALLTYDRRSQRWAVQGVRETLPQISLRLNFESSGRSRYDYADLGFRID